MTWTFPQKRPKAVEGPEKVCKGCGILKPIGDFYPHPINPAIHRSKCKECCKKYQKSHYHKEVKDV